MQHQAAPNQAEGLVTKASKGTLIPSEALAAATSTPGIPSNTGIQLKEDAGTSASAALTPKPTDAYGVTQRANGAEVGAGVGVEGHVAAE